MIDLRRIPDRWRRADVMARDLPLALVLAAVAYAPAFRGHGTRVGDLPTRPFDALAHAVVALECLPLLGRRRWPAGCLVLVSLGFAADQLRGYHTVAGTALPIALLSVGAHLEVRRRTLAVLASLAYLPLAVALSRGGSSEGVSGFVTFYLALVIAWGIGAWLRTTRAVETERRRQVAQAARLAERARIAAELHDVVTHHVTAMVVQVEAARYRTTSPEHLDETLTAVATTGRRAIADLRHLLDLLIPDHGSGPGAVGVTSRGADPGRSIGAAPDPRTDAGPGAGTDAGTGMSTPRGPSVGELDALVERTRRAGQPVEFVQDGVPGQMTGSAEVAAYRVVQEALTNALKYAHGSPTVVRVHHGTEEITVEVDTEGPGSRAGSPGGSGRGLTGLRDRVGLLGGDFSAGRRPGGGFVVRARIPTGSPS